MCLCCSVRRGNGVKRVCVRKTQEKKGAGMVGGDKRGRQQMFGKFQDKTLHVWPLEGIVEMTMKPERPPALSQ